jgi:hypothetical protein
MFIVRHENKEAFLCIVLQVQICVYACHNLATASVIPTSFVSKE